MLFLSFITGICEVSKVKIVVGDERVKSEGALTTRIVKRIIEVSITTITLEHPVTTINQGYLLGSRRYCMS